MSTQPEHDTERVSRSLHRQVDDLLEAPFTLDDVRGRARSIRRRRAGVGAGVAAVVAAIVVPVLLVAAPGANRTDGPAPATQLPAPTALRLTYLEIGKSVQGFAPSILHLSDGSTVTLGSGVGGFVPDQAVVLADGRTILSGEHQGFPSVVVYAAGPDGRPSGDSSTLYDSEGSLVANADDTAVAWMGDRGTPMVLQPGTSKPHPLTPVTGRRPTIVALDGSDCAESCGVLVSVGEGKGAANVYDSSHGGQKRYAAGLSSVSDESGDQTLVGGAPAPNGVDCAAVWSNPMGRLLWKSCVHTDLQFSPGGTYVSATAGMAILGKQPLTILNARTGKVTATLPSAYPVAAVSWEDDDHLLVVQESGAGWQLERLGVDGSVSRVAGPAGGHSPPYVLP